MLDTQNASGQRSEHASPQLRSDVLDRYTSDRTQRSLSRFGSHASGSDRLQILKLHKRELHHWPIVPDATLAKMLGDLYGRKIVLQVAIVIFLVGSALCGLAQDTLSANGTKRTCQFIRRMSVIGGKGARCYPP